MCTCINCRLILHIEQYQYEYNKGDIEGDYKYATNIYVNSIFP